MNRYERLDYSSIRCGNDEVREGLVSPEDRRQARDEKLAETLVLEWSTRRLSIVFD